MKKTMKVWFNEEKNRYYARFSTRDGLLPIETENIGKHLLEELNNGFTISKVN